MIMINKYYMQNICIKQSACVVITFSELPLFKQSYKLLIQQCKNWYNQFHTHQNANKKAM